MSIVKTHETFTVSVPGITRMAYTVLPDSLHAFTMYLNDEGVEYTVTEQGALHRVTANVPDHLYEVLGGSVNC